MPTGQIQQKGRKALLFYANLFENMKDIRMDYLL